MADNITYRFIQNVGDYFPSGYFTDDFINKVQSCAGYSADDMKALCSPYVQMWRIRRIQKFHYQCARP